MRLMMSALIKYLLGLVMVGLLLFLPAGSPAYGNGWLFIGLLFGSFGCCVLTLELKRAFFQK